MPYITEEAKQEILKVATLEAVLKKYLSPARGSHKNPTYICPMCGKELEYHPGKNLCKCFHCDFGTNSPVTFLMETEKMDYVEAMEKLAKDFGVVIPDVPRPTPPTPAKAKAKSFCNRQLELSGLTHQDVRAMELRDDGTSIDHSPIFPGSVDQFGHWTDQGDDMVIRYLDLDGRVVMYQDKRKGENGKMREFFRVRWQIPESHVLKDGSICKYKSPAGSGVQIYIPEKIRAAYRKAQPIENLFFTEGEKKAEAVSKYVGLSFGLGGINSLVSKERQQMPESVVRVIEQCGVKRVYFIMDSDYNDLSRSLTPESDATQRPKTFFAAARNFRDWFLTLKNRGLNVEVYLVLGAGDGKGVDDQLMMLGEDKTRYLQDLERATNDAVAGGHVDGMFDVVKITTMTDGKLMDIWSLGDVDTFAQAHIEELSKLETFHAFRNQWKIEAGALKLAQPLMENEEFWERQERTDRMGNPIVDYRFDYENMIRFFSNRGYFRYLEENGEYSFIHIDGKKVEHIKPFQARDYALSTAASYRSKDLMNMLYRNYENYLGPSKLGLIPFTVPDFLHPEKESQTMLFKSKYWKISAAGIEEHNLSEIPEYYWDNSLKDYDAHRLKERMVKVQQLDEGFQIDITSEGMKCEFLNFLLLASWFDWEKQLDSDRTPIDGRKVQITYEACQHLLSKMTAIGYLLHNYHNPGCAKAVIAMDERISAVGESQGRSGKSLLGLALEVMQPTVTIPAKNIDFNQDKFLWEEVNAQTKTVVLDDIPINFDFEQMFPLITTSITINGKGVGRFTLSGHKKPKFYITTNHTINGNNGSTRDRQFKIAFSNYFDDSYKPEREFGHQFFSEDWDGEQWNLFYNFMAECLTLYFEAQHNHWGVAGSGLIEANCANLERRQMRQQMTENFYRWMLDWIGIDEDDPNGRGSRFDVDFERIPMYEAYKNYVPMRERNYITPQKFWQRLVLFCKYFDYLLNPQIPQTAKGEPGHDKRGGVEHIIIAQKAPIDKPM